MVALFLFELILILAQEIGDISFIPAYRQAGGTWGGGVVFILPIFHP